jgi:hypothetical protein
MRTADLGRHQRAHKLGNAHQGELAITAPSFYFEFLSITTKA